MKGKPRLSFGLIVLNGEPFIKYWLRSVYPWAHEIIVVEGAVPSAAGTASQDGHSLDGTLQSIREFQQIEDIEHKITLVIAEDEGQAAGFWPGEKTQMCQAYAKRATGDMLVTLDVDEFLLDSDYPKVLEQIQQGATHISFNTITFWGGIRYRTEGFWTISHRLPFNRIMQWGPEYRYVEHRPPTVVDCNGIDVQKISSVTAKAMEKKGIVLYHFSHVFPKQVIDKSTYYATKGMQQLTRMDRWAQDCYLRLEHPFRVHNVYRNLSWLERYNGPVPQYVSQMMDDIHTGKCPVETRSTDDVERLLSHFWYRLTTLCLRRWAGFITTKRGKLFYRVLNSFYIRLPRRIRIFDPPF